MRPALRPVRTGSDDALSQEASCAQQALCATSKTVQASQFGQLTRCRAHYSQHGQHHSGDSGVAGTHQHRHRAVEHLADAKQNCAAASRWQLRRCAVVPVLEVAVREASNTATAVLQARASTGTVRAGAHAQYSALPARSCTVHWHAAAPVLSVEVCTKEHHCDRDRSAARPHQHRPHAQQIALPTHSSTVSSCASTGVMRAGTHAQQSALPAPSSSVS
jgi:hypothetical protein